MKTLDEVIKAYEVCHASILSCEGCPYDNGERYRDSDCYTADALHYLMEYREKAHRLDIDIAYHPRSFEQLGVEIARYHEAVRNCEEAENKYRKMEDELNDIRREHIEQMKNPALTWDELRQMEGKPVWFEGYAGNFWCIVREMQKNSDGTEDVIFDGPHGMTGVGHDDQYGDKWQAYRKERK